MNEQELRIVISATIDELQKNVKKAQKEVEEFSKESKTSFKEVNDSMQQIGGVSKKALGAVSIAVAGVATSILALGASTSEYRNEQAKLITAFEAAGGSAEEAKETYNDLYRVLGDGGQATEAANHLAKLTTNEKDLAQWTNICQGVYATFGDSLPIESLTEAANETAKTGQLTGALADALNWAGVSEDDFQASLDACNTEAEREKKIRETLNGIYDDAAKKYEENNKEVLAQNEANAKLEDSMAKLGEAVAPINTLLTELATEVLAILTPYIQEFAENYLPVLKDILGEVAEVIGAVIGWIVDNWELVASIAGVILGIATALSLVSTVMGIVNAVMAVSPVTWIIMGIVAAIAAVVAIIIVCIEYWDEIKETVSNVLSAIGGFFSDLWESVTSGLQAAWDWMVGLVSGIADWIYNTLIKPVADFFTGLWNGFKNAASNAWNGVKSVFSSVADFFGNIFSKAWEKVKKVFSVGGKIFDGIKDGIITAFKAVVNVIIKGINTVVALPFNGLNGILNTLQDLSFLGISPFGWLTWRAPVPQIPLLEQGGVLKKGQIGLLEGNGAEAVVPLEKNTQWLDRIADRLNAATGNGTPIIMQVDGKTFAEISVASINQLTRQRGSLPLVLG